MSESWFSLVGVICSIAIASSIAFGMVVWSWCFYVEKVRDPVRRSHERRGQLDTASQLIRDHWWFSEDLPTKNLLNRIAEGLITNGAYNISSIRDQWREERTKTNPERSGDE